MFVAMPLLAPTPPERLVDAQGRPYFLWDEELTIDQFRALLRHEDVQVRACYLGKMMRQAKTDDVFTFMTRAEVEELLPAVERYLGKTKDFWLWLFAQWRSLADRPSGSIEKTERERDLQSS
jgi:hypothetical protein